jgi:protein-tyrosine phosphatase
VANIASHFTDPLEVNSHFGTYRGLIRLALGFTEHVFGGLDHFRSPDWCKVERLVFVCRGNICRSAYAEARARGLGLHAASFGLSTMTGAAANEIVIQEALRREMDLTPHRTTDARDFEFREGDLLVAMEPRQGREMLQRFSKQPCQFTLLGLWANPVWPHIHDPHGLSIEYLRKSMNIIDSAVVNIARSIGTNGNCNR